MLGGVIGNQMGKGTGKDLATIGGAVLGGIAGHQVEKNTRTVTRYDISVRMDNGEHRVVTVRMRRCGAGATAWRSRDGQLVAPQMISRALPVERRGALLTDLASSGRELQPRPPRPSSLQRRAPACGEARSRWLTGRR